MTTESSADPLADTAELPTVSEASSPNDNGTSEATASASPPGCPGCGTPRGEGTLFCGECGFLFPEKTPVVAGEPNRHPQAGSIVGGRYQICELISQRGAMLRFRGLDVGGSSSDSIHIVILRELMPPVPPPPDNTMFDIESFDLPLKPATADPASLLADTRIVDAPVWPSLTWEKRLLTRLSHLSLPRMLDSFDQDGFEYLIVEVPLGQSLWDAWDELPLSWPRRCEWLIQIAEALEQLHESGAMLEGLRPDIVVVTPTSQAVIANFTDLLPLPLPPDVPVRGSYYSAPELVLGSADSGARADLYGFGAMVQALLFGRELTDFDFTLQGVPRPYLERFPDGHPLLGRLLSRTFVREIERRFPSHDYAEADPTGFKELIETLTACSRALDTIRIDIASWSNTGVVRSGNEDALAVLHSAEARLEDSDDFAVIVLADGMGGMASGEVAAAMTIQIVRDYFMHHPPFTDLFVVKPEVGIHPPPSQLILEALRESNRIVFEESRKHSQQRGMGCTAEVVLIDGKHVYVGHVGDSRTYHSRHGKLTQVTMDQTLVAHLVALGQLTPEEAARHPQRSELQQAIGGRKEVYPESYSFTMEAGDWLLVCSDGLTNQLDDADILGTLHSAGSAEKAARRLVNRAILEGALDNVTVVVVRAC